jgi:DNA-binding response OmpR family regulator
MKKLLVVDDHHQIRRVVCLALKGRYALDEADSAEAAYARIRATKPAGIVLDIMMPGTMDGLDLCRRIKNDADLADIYVVLLSARGQVADQNAGYACGADAYFVKPFRPSELVRHLDSVLGPRPDNSGEASR